MSAPVAHPADTAPEALAASAARPRSLLSINAYHYAKGGADIVYLNHARLMEERGWRNSFFSMHHAENLPCEDAAYFAEEIDYARRGSGLKTLIDASRVVYSFEAQSKIARLLDSRAIDIAHVHNIYHHQSPSILVELKRRGIPTVLTAHDLKLACPAYTMLNETGVCERCKGGKTWNVLRHRCIKGSLAASALIMLESSVHKALDLYARNVDKIIVPSRFYREKLIEWGFDPAQLVYIPNFIPDREPIKPQLGGDYILFFGRLSKEKGLATLVRAAALSRVPVWIVGRGPQEEELRQLARELDAPVSFKGFQRGDALWSMVDGARAVVLPSEWYENGPLSVIEGFQRGKPLIGARIGGIPELVEENATGWLFTAGDAEDLARTMRKVADISTDRLAHMAECCVSLANSRFSESSYLSAIETLYRGLM